MSLIGKMAGQDEPLVGDKERVSTQVLERHYPRRDLVLVPLPDWPGSFQAHTPTGPISKADFDAVSEACGRIVSTLKDRVVESEAEVDE